MTAQRNQAIWKWESGTLCPGLDELAVEEPLEIRLRGRGVAVTMRTPGHDPELAIGFLLTEGIVRSASEIVRMEHCERNDAENVLNVLLGPDVHVDFDRLSRHVFTSSSCGLCGKSTIESVQRTLPRVDSDLTCTPQLIAGLPAIMRSAQQTFDRTGGLHAAAIFDAGGKLVVLREDVGRHNAVDKVIGYCAVNGPFPLNRHILLVSGRSSFEIVQKALAARIPMLAAVSAPSSMAVELAQESGQTLIGFLRGQKMNVYTHPQRMIAREFKDEASDLSQQHTSSAQPI